MKKTVLMAFTMLGLAVALAGCPKDEGTDAAPGTDAANPGTDAGGGSDSGMMCVMGASTCLAVCTTYLATCDADNNFPPGYTQAMCEADCAGLTQTVIDCRGYHSCVAATFAVGSGDRDDHCDHSIGMGGFCM